MFKLKRCGTYLAAVGLGAALVSCSSSPGTSGTPSATPLAAESVSETESSRAKPRLALTYDGGILILDALTLDQVADLKIPGQLHLNPAGDNRSLLVTEEDSFRVLDLGVWTQEHGDHDHSHATDPKLTERRFPGPKPGHVAVHEGWTTVFYDGSGEYKAFESKELSKDDIPAITEYRTLSAHHGVAMMLHDGLRIETLGNDKERVGARVLDAQNKEVAKAENCPSVHGEAVVKDETVVLGCADGMIAFDGSKFIKLASPDPNGRIANVVAHDRSAVVLSDYRTSPADKPEPPDRVALADLTAGSVKTVALPSSYSYRSLGRGPAGEGLVLNEDGKLRVLDPATGNIVQEVQVVKPWTQPAKSQEPRPSLRVLGQRIYVTEPASSQVHVIDPKEWKVTTSRTLGQVPNEIQGVTG